VEPLPPLAAGYRNDLGVAHARIGELEAQLTARSRTFEEVVGQLEAARADVHRRWKTQKLFAALTPVTFSFAAFLQDLIGVRPGGHLISGIALICVAVTSCFATVLLSRNATRTAERRLAELDAEQALLREQHIRVQAPQVRVGTDMAAADEHALEIESERPLERMRAHSRS
jgi:hypothetical protein